jgi:hypothetical protein
MKASQTTLNTAKSGPYAYWQALKIYTNYACSENTKSQRYNEGLKKTVVQNHLGSIQQYNFTIRKRKAIQITKINIKNNDRG